MRAHSPLLLASFTSVALAHGGVWYYKISGKQYDGYKWWETNTTQATIQRKWPSRNPLEQPDHPYMACNIDGAPPTNIAHAEIEVGQTIDAHYDKRFKIPSEPPPGTEWPSGKVETWGHQWGPTIVYLAACPGPCHEWNVSLQTVKWFKIAEAGLLSGNAINGTWGGTLLYNGLPLSTKIPETLKPGYYLIRHEVIANHMLTKQFYPECAQLKVTGGGTSFPGDEYLVTFPGAYSNRDPGLGDGTEGAYWSSLWGNASDTYYPMHGPKLWTG